MQRITLAVLILLRCTLLTFSETLPSTHSFRALSDSLRLLGNSKQYLATAPLRESSAVLTETLLEYGKIDPPLRNSKANQCRQVDEAVFFLDLDKTAIFGNDGNDLPMALQWMEKPHSVVCSLYKKLVNPNIRLAFEAMKKKAKKVHVVIYTRRTQVVNYKSSFRDTIIPMQYKREWHQQDGQLCFPQHIRKASDITRHYCGPERLSEEIIDMEKAVERLIAARDAITEELGLAIPPPVVVTSNEKDVDRTAAAMGLPGTNAFLFDDNANIKTHHGVIHVDPLESVPRAMRDSIINFMESQLPTSECDEDLVEYLRGARAGEEAIEWDNDNCQWRWRVPVMEGNPCSWTTPEIVVADRKLKDGSMSPVTPWSEGSSGSISRSDASDSSIYREVADLRVAVERAAAHRKWSIFL